MEYGLVLWWLVAYLALLAVGAPLAALVLSRFADRGAGFAMPIALAVVWFVVFLGGHLSLSLAMYAGFAVLFVAAGVALYRPDDSDGGGSDGGDADDTTGQGEGFSLERRVDIDRRGVAEAAVVFTVAFLFMIAVRAVDAGVHPTMGEKFLDYGMLKSILRAETLPPEDFWFAGRPVKYYYGGHLVAAILTRLTGTEPRFAYNLALAGFYGMVVTAAYGFAGSIAASRNLSRVRAGLFGAFFVGFASNLATVLEIFRRQSLSWLTASGREGGFWYWRASRVIDGTINEFPLFAWLNGDMHAHMMSTAFVLLTAAVLFEYYRTPAEERWRRRLLVFGVVPPLAGMLAVVNTWSFATAGGLTFLALALAPTDPLELWPRGLADAVPSRERWQSELGRHVTALVSAALVVSVGVFWSLPFWLVASSGRSIGFFPDTSPMNGLLAVHGAFVLIFALHLLRHGLPRLDSDHADVTAVLLALGVVLAWGGASSPALALFGPMILVAWILFRVQDGHLASAAGGVADRARGAVSDGGSSLADAADPLATGADGDRDDANVADSTAQRIRDAVGYETLLLIAGAGIVVLVEFVYVKEQAGPGRFNTVFKTYADVWVLWAVGAAAALAGLVENHSPDLALSGPGWRTAMRYLAIGLVLSTSVYGVVALSDHFTGESYINPNSHTDNPTLDGLRYVEERHPDEYPAIQWFDSLEGQPNIVEAPGTDMYRWTNPVSSLTGVPTLAGWAHERGYGRPDAYPARVDDVDTIYTGSAQQRAFLLEAYKVEYIYVGTNEQDPRDGYSSRDLAVFDEMAGVTLEKQWGQRPGAVLIYRVDRSELNVPE
jgi:YYY domain-containing protein